MSSVLFYVKPLTENIVLIWDNRQNEINIAALHPRTNTMHSIIREMTEERTKLFVALFALVDMCADETTEKKSFRKKFLKYDKLHLLGHTHTQTNVRKTYARAYTGVSTKNRETPRARARPHR